MYCADLAAAKPAVFNADRRAAELADEPPHLSDAQRYSLLDGIKKGNGASGGLHRAAR